jgi:hypothetical protein
MCVRHLLVTAEGPLPMFARHLLLIVEDRLLMCVRHLLLIAEDRHPMYARHLLKTTKGLDLMSAGGRLLMYARHLLLIAEGRLLMCASHQKCQNRHSIFNYLIRFRLKERVGSHNPLHLISFNYTHSIGNHQIIKIFQPHSL